MSSSQPAEQNTVVQQAVCGRQYSRMSISKRCCTRPVPTKKDRCGAGPTATLGRTVRSCDSQGRQGHTCSLALQGSKRAYAMCEHCPNKSRHPLTAFNRPVSSGRGGPYSPANLYNVQSARNHGWRCSTTKHETNQLGCAGTCLLQTGSCMSIKFCFNAR